MPDPPDTIEGAGFRVGQTRSEQVSATNPATRAEFHVTTEDGANLRTRVSVLVRNGTTNSATEDVTVDHSTLFGGGETQFDTATQSVTVAALDTELLTFFTDPVALPEGQNRVTASITGTTLEIVETTVHTRDINHTWRRKPDGSYQLADTIDRTVLEVKPGDTAVRFPGGVRDQQHNTITDFTGTGLSVTNGQLTASTADALNIIASGDGTTDITLTHNLGYLAETFTILPTTADANGTFYKSDHGLNTVTLTYDSAPPSGTDNLAYDVVAHGVITNQSLTTSPAVGTATTPAPGVALVELIVDSFEDNDLSEYSGGSGLNVVDSGSGQVYSGTYALECTTGFSSAESQSGLDNYPSAGDTFNVWVYPTSTTGEVEVRFAIDSGDDSNRYHLEIGGDGDVKLQDGAFNLIARANGGIATDVWNRVRCVWGAGGSFDIEIYDESGTLQSSDSGSDSQFTSGGIGFGDSGIDAPFYVDRWFIES